MVLWCVISSCKVTETVRVSQSIKRTTKQGKLSLIIRLSFIEIKKVHVYTHTHMHDHTCKHAHTKQSTHGRKGTKSLLAETKILCLEDEISSLFPSKLAGLDHHRESNNTNKEKGIRLLLDRGAPLSIPQG